jgi:transglutaminase-like putative cysteine protease
MMTDRYAEERIRRWLNATAPPHLPDRVLTDTYERTRRMAQASRSRTWWYRVTRPLPIVFAAGAITIVLVAVSVGLGTSDLAEPAQPVSATIGALWTTDSGTAVTIERDPTDDGRYYWKAATYDQVDLQAWSSSISTTVARARGARLLEGMADDVDGNGLQPLAFTIRPESFRAPTVLSPGTPIAVDRAVRVTTVGEGGYVATVDRGGGGGAYTVTAFVHGQGGAAPPTESGLRTAGTDYPAEIVDLYTVLPAGALGPNTATLRDDIVRTADSSAPYDVAQRLVEVLQDPTAYTYDTDVRDLDCGARSVAECFATYRRGYCQYYATTMAVVLRDLGIPARLVDGFLPGERGPGSAFEVVSTSAAHAWVEVYFPGYEWIPFDPTGGGIAQLQALP